ncbi:hypothetical protein EJ419_01715 [Alloscardovia theropitheci]|uniref:Membrane associated protein n=1 Tax=Alloscardovia theropitheci TaxID=2496842 RepID=A0A4R0QYH7_9BIFI|nr:tetraspanin family protein [Alloscardovia theropitheci]TCD54840.1 hypothetical protein EJ419_01715 [Alloscardovia theropitheci]
MTNDNLSKSHDDAWNDFINGHDEELSSIENSRAAKKFERKAQRADAKVRRDEEKRIRTEEKFAVSDFDKSVFGKSQSNPRGFSSSWLDVDEASNHFQPPQFEESPIPRSTVIGALLFIIGIVGVFVSLFFLSFNGFVGMLSFIVLLVGLAILLSVRSPRAAGNSNGSSHTNFPDRAQI